MAKETVKVVTFGARDIVRACGVVMRVESYDAKRVYGVVVDNGTGHGAGDDFSCFRGDVESVVERWVEGKGMVRHG